MTNRKWALIVPQPRLIECFVVGGILAVVAIGGMIAIGRSGSLGYDEAVYASKARSLVTDIPASGWAIYRPPGLPWLGIAVSPIGFSDETLRALTLVLALSSLLAVWGLARRMSGSEAGLIALVAVLGCPVLLTEIRTFHNDLPAVGMVLVLMILLWHQFESRVEPNALLLAAGPIAAAAFYLRFATIAPICAIGIAAVLLWGRQIGRHTRLVAGTATIACVLILPHVVAASMATGSPFGILRLAADQREPTGPLDAVIQYVQWLPLQLAGAGLVVILVAVIDALRACIGSIRQRALTADARRHMWLLLPAAITTAAFILLLHPERRYVLLPLVLALISGAGPTLAGVRRLFRMSYGRWTSYLPNREFVALFVGLAAAGTLAASRQQSVIDYNARQTQWRADAGEAIAEDASGPCTVVTTLAPVIGWYSGCDAVPFTTDPAVLVDGQSPATSLYVVIAAVDRQRVRTELIDRYRALIDPQPLEVIPAGIGEPATEIYRIRH